MLALLRRIGANLLKEARPGKAEREEYYGPAKQGNRGAGGDRTMPIDARAEEIIISALKGSGEPLTVISEEAGVVELHGGGRKVIIDPIDGSRNAVTGIPYYGASIAVADGGRLGDVVLSYVVNLASGDEFWAERDGGAFLNGRRVSAQRDEILYVVGFEAQNPGPDIRRILPLLGAARRARCLGAIAIDLALLASGALSVAVMPGRSRSFDFAGGWLLAREAGAVVTDLDGKSIEGVELNLQRSAPILGAGNEALHRKALGLLGTD